jgi:hypothetical protein
LQTCRSRERIDSCLLRGLLLVAALIFAIPEFTRATAAPQAGSASVTGRVTVTTGEGTTNNLSGITVKLTGTTPGAAPQTTLTDSDGRYTFARLAAGNYNLGTTVEGFNPWTATVTLASGQVAVEDAALQISSVEEKVEVQGEATEMATQSVTATASVSEQQLEELPLRTGKFTEALSVSPSVIRTQEGQLNFNGQAESQGMLLVDSTESVDPVSGSFAIPVPVDAIESIKVYNTPDSSQFGGFSGGLTRIELKPPPNAWISKLHDFVPAFRAKGGHLVGLANITPRLEFGGPLIKDKLNVFEEMVYEYRRDPVRGLTWPYNETYVRSFNSLTDIQETFSSQHLLNVSINIFPANNSFANINALIPQTASANYRRRGISVGISDAYQFHSGLVLDTVVRYMYFDTKAYGQGTADMTISPAGWGGNFFNTWSRTANQVEILPSVQLPTKNWRGRHEIKFGTDILYRNYDGSSISRPVQLLAEDNSLTEEIDFQGAGLLHANSAETSVFAQDHWTLNSHISLNYGARLTTQSIGRDIALAPIVGFAYAPGSGKTVLRAGAVFVYGHVPLLAADYADNQERVITVTGMQPVTLQNVYLPTGSTLTSPGSTDPGSSPRTFTWNAEVEHAVRKNLSLRAAYIETHTTNLFVVDPMMPTSGAIGTLALLDSGSSHYRQLELTAHYRPVEKADVSVSYAWSRARGDLNALSDTYVPFEAPVIRPNSYGIMPSDIPNRVIASGTVDLPWNMVITPIADFHSGFPYSNVDVLQNYVGAPESLRFPFYISLDAKLYRDFPIHFPFTENSKKHKVRVGVFTLNGTNHQNPHDVYNNVSSPIFGEFAGFQRRFTGVTIGLGESTLK